MKRSLSSPICPSGFSSVFEDDDELVNGGDDDLFSCGGGGGGPGQHSEKKRRLSADQVRALEKNFEVENKLEPERKVRLAQELGLQPRQVAVWFQNRRARWKTKQLERDFGALKSRYDALRLDYDSLLRDKELLLTEVKDLKAKLAGEESGFSSVKDEPVASDSETKAVEEETLTLIYNKDGSSDSDSSAVLNDDNIPMIGFNGGGPAGAAAGGGGLFYQQQIMKVEDGFLDGDEPCSFFADDQPPTLSWYCGGGWE